LTTGFIIILRNVYEGIMMKKQMKRTIYMTIALIGLIGLFAANASADGDAVVMIEVGGEVNAAMTAYISDAMDDAEAAGRPVVLVLDTYGGQILEADKIKERLLSATVPVDCYITRNALSAGTLIAISCERILMAESAVIGAAETIPNDEKTLSTWVGILKSTAEARGRDTLVVQALADSDISIEGVTEAGSLLTLSASEARALGISDGTAPATDDALSMLGYGGRRTIDVNMDFPVHAAQFLTSTVVASLLFLAGIVLMGIEIFTAGFGVFGVLSIICFGLYFFGGFLAGFAQWWSLALFAAGLVLFGIEAAVPGFGVFGILGIVCVVAGVMFAARDMTSFLTILAVGAAGSIILLPVVFKILGRLGLLRKIALAGNMTVEEGYVSHEMTESLVGKTGTALTVLRPSGTARIDGVRHSVVSQGDYIEPGTAIVVVAHTPGRIVVDTVD
jgi:membrane-bound serine protease (ClpP class)